MKKVILVLAICLGISFTLTSCKKEKKEEVKTEDVIIEDGITEDEITKAVEVVDELETKDLSNTLYQCPMNCEKGKSYIKEGSCPVCKMNLKPKEVDMNSDATHEHSEEELEDKSGRIAKDAKVESTPNN